MTSAAINTDGSLIRILLKIAETSDSIRIKFGSDDIYSSIDKEATQTILDKL